MKGFLTTSNLSDALGITLQGVYKILKKSGIELVSTDSKRKRIPALGVRKLLKDKGYTYPIKNISFQIVKGGVGKTSLSYALGLRASHYGAKVLLIDLDQQGNLTRSFKIEARDHPVWLNVVRDQVQIDKAIIEISDTLSLLPSNLNNSRLDLEITQSTINPKELVRDKLSEIRNMFDIVIFDCPPAINKINLCATCASDLIIIPLNPDPYAMDGLEFTLSELGRIKKDFKLQFEYKIVWNRYDARERLGSLYMHELVKEEERFKHVLPIVIRVDASLKNSIFDEIPLFASSKKSAIRDDIDEFTKEILGINEWAKKRARNR